MAGTTGIMLDSGDGEHIFGGAIDVTVKVTMADDAFASTFEIRLPAGYDVGAHVHAQGEEVFYVVRGQLDVLAFEPLDRSLPDWHEWEAADGRRFLRGGPGAFMYVPPNVPHAFSNPGNEETLIFFQSSVPGGHENYFKELAELLRRTQGRPDRADMIELRQRYHIEQLTDLRVRT